MKELLLAVHPRTKRTAVIGSVLLAFVLAVSAVFYFGAGRGFDYYFAKDAAEKLLTAARPLGVALCSVLLFSEYKARKN